MAGAASAAWGAGGAAVAAGVLWAYRRTLFASIPGGDSGELVAEACQLGVAHPPGYPAFVYFARAAIEAARGVLTPAAAVNLACAACGAFCCAATYGVIVNALTLGGDAARRGRPWVPICAAGAALLLGFSPLMWLYSIGAEVFALNNALVAALLVACSILAVVAARPLAQDASSASQQGAGSVDEDAWRRGVVRWSAVCAFCSGLCLTNQHTSILFIVPLVAWVAVLQLRLVTPRLVLKYAASFAAGMAPYLHMPLAHTFWRGRGSWGDTSTWAGFKAHFLREDYGTFRLFAREDSDRETLAPRTVAYLRDLLQEQLPHPAIGLLFFAAVVCVAVCLKRGFSSTCERPLPAAAADDAPASGGGAKHGAPKRQKQTAVPPKAAAGDVKQQQLDQAQPAPLHVQWAQAVAHYFPALVVLMLPVVYFSVFHSLSNMPLTDKLLYGVHQRFWMQPNITVFASLGIGAAALCDGVAWLLQCGGRDIAGKSARVAAIFCAAAGAGAWLVHAQFVRNVARMDHSGNDVVAQYGRALLEPLPHGAILITGYDHQWTSTRYLQTCEGLRPDVAILNAQVMSFQWFKAQRSLYPTVSFPGTHLVPHFTGPHGDGECHQLPGGGALRCRCLLDSTPLVPAGPAAAGGFSLADFFVANTVADAGAAYAASYVTDVPHDAFGSPRDIVLAKACPTPDGQCTATNGTSASRHNGGVFYTGAKVAKDDESSYNLQFEFVPRGIVSQVVPKYAGALKRLTTWRNVTKALARPGDVRGKPRRVDAVEIASLDAAWRATIAVYNSSTVNVTWLDEYTWEYATRVDFWQQAIAYATYLLEWALSPAGVGLRAAPANGDETVNVTAALQAAAILEDGLEAQLEQGSLVLNSTYKNLVSCEWGTRRCLMDCAVCGA